MRSTIVLISLSDATSVRAVRDDQTVRPANTILGSIPVSPCYRQKTAVGYSFKETFLVSSRGARSFGPLINCQASERCGHHCTMMIIQIRDGRTRVQ